MNKAQRIRYQVELWPAACQGQGWSASDDARRRDLRQYCWDAIGLGNQGERMPADQAEVTALFTLLVYLAEPDNITLSQQWDDCKANYKAFNLSRQADHWQRKAYGESGGHRLARDRFAGRKKAHQPAFADNPLDEEGAKNRLMTMRARARSKERKTQPATT